MLFTASVGLSLAHKVIMFFHITCLLLLAKQVNILIILCTLNFLYMLFTASVGLSLAHKVNMIFHIKHLLLLAKWVNIIYPLFFFICFLLQPLQVCL